LIFHNRLVKQTWGVASPEETPLVIAQPQTGRVARLSYAEGYITEASFAPRLRARSAIAYHWQCGVNFAKKLEAVSMRSTTAPCENWPSFGSSEMDHAVNERLQQISPEMYRLLDEQRTWLNSMSDDEAVGRNRRLLRLAKEFRELSMRQEGCW